MTVIQSSAHERTTGRHAGQDLTPTMVATSVAGGAAWLALGTESIVRPEVMHYRDALVLVPLTLYGATLAGIHAIQRHRSGRLGRWSTGLVLAAMAVTLAGNLAMVLGASSVQSIAFPLGPVAWMVGMVAFGVATARAGVFGRRAGWLIGLSQPLTMVTAAALSPIAPLEERGAFSGAIAHGVVMLLLAATVRQHAQTPGR